jgi:hypothetical protein
MLSGRPSPLRISKKWMARARFQRSSNQRQSLEPPRGSSERQPARAGLPRAATGRRPETEETESASGTDTRGRRVLESGDAFVSRRSPGPVERICPGSQGPGLEAGCEEGASCEKRVARRAVPRAGRRARPSRERERRRSITVPDQTSQNEDVLFRTPRRRTNITVVS